MVAGTLYGGITNAFAQQSNNIGNFASVTQSNSAVSVADASASATGGNGGSGLVGSAGGPATATGGTAISAVSQSNENTIDQSIDRSILVGVNSDRSDCKCDGKAQTNNIGNFATVSQSNEAVSIADASASATGGNGGNGFFGGGAGGAGTATGGSATSAVSQSNANTITQSISQSFLGGFNFR